MPQFLNKVSMSAHDGAVVVDTDATTITFDCVRSDKHKVVLGGNRNLALSGDTDGQTLLIILQQDATGGRTVTWWSGIVWASGAPPTLSTTANQRDIFSFIRESAGVYLGFVVSLGSSQISGTGLRPYDPQTRPWYLDMFWTHFKGRPFPVNGVYGFVGSPTVGINVTLSVAVAVGGVFLTLQTGQGAYFVPGQTVVVGSGFVWQAFTVNSITGDQLTVFPKSQFAFAIGTQCYHQFENDTHPNSVPGWNAWGQAIADAKQGRSLCGTNLLGLSGGNPIGGMDAFYTDANSIANVPVGWVTMTPTQIQLMAIASYATTDKLPAARSGFGAYIATKTTDTGGTGIQLVTPIPVRPGEVYVCSANMMDLGAGAMLMQVADSDSGTVFAQGPLSGDVNWQNYESLGMAAYFPFLVPSGTSNIKIQVVSIGASGNIQIDNVRLLRSRQNIGTDRYVIEDPGSRPIVCLGDSWDTVGGGFTAIANAIQNRLPTAQLVCAGVSGQRLDQLVARMATDVFPYRPIYCILATAFMNDLTQNRTQSQMETDLDAFIDGCRANGIIPVIPGLAPSSNASITGGLQTCHDRNDQMRARCDRINI
jgi:hypothetical protein